MKERNLVTRMAAVIFLVFGLTVSAQAQPVRMESSNADRMPEVWNKYLGNQLALSLASPITEIKIIALENTVLFARRRDGTLNLKPAIPALSKIYRKDPDERCRILATAGLHSIGDVDGMLKLRDGLRLQESKEVQWVAVSALLDYFGQEAFTKDKEMMELAASLVRYYKNRPLPLIPEEQEPEPVIAISK